VVYNNKKDFNHDIEADKATLSDFKLNEVLNIHIPIKVGKTIGMNLPYSLIFL